MSVVGSLVGSIAQDVMAEGVGGFTYPDSTIAVYDATDSDGRTITSSPDIDALINVHSPGTFDVSQSTAGEKPHYVATSPEHADFDGSDDVLLYSGSNVVAAGDFFSYFVIAELFDTGGNDFFFSIANPSQPFDSFLRRTGTGNLDCQAIASEGSMNPSVAFTPDGDYHLFGIILTSTGTQLTVDGTRQTAALANTGLVRNATALSIGARVDAFVEAQMRFRKGVVLKNPTSDDTNAVEAQLLSEVP